MGVVFGKIAEELPRNYVVHTASTYAVRRYEPSIAATCSYGASRWGQRSSDRSPFGALANYIGVFSKPANAKGVPGECQGFRR